MTEYPPMARSGPLSGHRVVELSSTIAGPVCARLLADFGAEVVKVEDIAGDPVRDLGSTTYPTYGFIYQDDKAQRVASSGLNAAGNTAIAMAQGAANQMASAVRPGAGPFSMLSQAADSTAALSLSVHEPSGIIVRSNARSRSASRRR